MVPISIPPSLLGAIAISIAMTDPFTLLITMTVRRCIRIKTTILEQCLPRRQSRQRQRSRLRRADIRRFESQLAFRCQSIVRRPTVSNVAGHPKDTVADLIPRTGRPLVVLCRRIDNSPTDAMQRDMRRRLWRIERRRETELVLAECRCLDLEDILVRRRHRSREPFVQD